MKIISFLLISIFIFFGAMSQRTGWKIIHNGILKVEATKENEIKNTFTLYKAELEKTGFLWINCTGINTPKGWKRIISLVDEKEVEVLKHGGSLCKVGNSFLRSVNIRQDVIKAYTWALPSDPAEAARIRVRRVHLCTIKLKD